MKRVLHTVAMVRIEVDIKDPRNAAIEQSQHGQRQIVQITKAARPVGPAVVVTVSIATEFQAETLR